MSDNTLLAGFMVFILLLVSFMLIITDANNSREHEQYVLCIEHGNQWVSGSCIYKP